MAGSAVWCVSLPRKSLRVNLISHNFLASAVFLTFLLATSDSKPTAEDDFAIKTILDGEVVNYDYFRDYSYSRQQIPKLADALDPVFYEFNFDPAHLEKKLMRTAYLSRTSPEQFQHELQLLVQCANNNHTDDYTVQNCRKSVDLEQKYGIDALPPPSFVDPPTIHEEYQFPNTITNKRLTMMFPQYLRFHHMKLNREHFNPACRQLDEILPKIMKYPEFAGFLLTLDDKPPMQNGRKMIGVYLYWQFCNVAPDERTEEHFEKIKKITLKRIGASRLPNADRDLFLRANNIITQHVKQWNAKELKVNEKYSAPFESLPLLVREAAAEYFTEAQPHRL